MKNYVRILAGPLLVLTVVVGALWLLQYELREYELQDFLDGLDRIPSSVLWSAVGLTCLNYVILIGYDLLGVTYLGQKMHWAKVAFGSFLGCAVGNNLGNLLGGSTVRYRLYSAWGLTAVDIVRMVLILSVTFWIGLFAVSGVMFIWRPVGIPGALHLPIATTRPLGVFVLGLAMGYLALCWLEPKGVKMGKWEFSPPPLGLSLLQYLVATMDLMVAAGVLYVLLPPSVEVDYFSFLTIYLLGLIATLITQVPGGVGVLELLIVVLLNPTDHRDVMSALLAFRAIYFLFPLAIGLFMLGLHELVVHQDQARGAFSVLGRWAPVVAPRLLGLVVFLAGVALLFSGAMPARPAQLVRLQQMVPLAVIELAHVIGSIVGVLLLVLTRGLQRRTEKAYFYVCGLLAMGPLLLVLQGARIGLPIGLAVVLVVFIPARPYFFRRGVRLTEWVSASWLVAVVGALGCTLWLFLFAFKYTQYQHELWWQFAFDSTASRSLRATFAAVVISLLLLAIRMVRVHEPIPGPATKDELQDAQRIVNRSRRAASHLAMLGDKRFLFNQQRDGFVMFGLEGNSCVAMGDPICPASSVRELAWEFWELCDVSGRRTVFYQIDEDNLPLYVELGLAVVKIGEEARVFLPEFEMEGRDHDNLQRALQQVRGEGCWFEIVDPISDPSILPALRQISDAWLASKSTSEKAFAIGYFDDDYLRRGPLALVRDQRRILGFANLWESAEREELSIDLMRYVPNAPPGLMDYLLVELIHWGNNQGYRWLNLGMAPFSDLQDQPHAPLWNELADVVFRLGAHFDDLKDLREFKENYRPRWTSKYLACPAGLSLVAVLADVASLITGGDKKRRLGFGLKSNSQDRAKISSSEMLEG